MKHTAPRQSELNAIIKATQEQLGDTRLALLFKFLAFSGRRITEVIGDQKHLDVLNGLRPIDIKDATDDEDEGKVAVYRILKKNQNKKGVQGEDKFYDYIKIKAKIFETGDTPQNRTRWQKLRQSLRRNNTYYQPVELPLSNTLYRLLRALEVKYEIGEKDRYFPFSYHKCRYVFEKAQLLAGVEYSLTPRPTKDMRKDATLYHIHQLRHYYATQIARNTKNVEQLMQLKHLLQHSNVSITQHYIDEDGTRARRLQDETFE